MSDLDLDSLAIVGMAVRAPGAATVDEFWRASLEGREAITWFTEEELRASGVPDAMLARPDYVRAGAILPDIDLFDAELFGLTPAEAALMDPQHRLFLECAWEALESAGHDPGRSPASIGAFGGCFMNKYLPLNIYTNAALLQSPAAFFARNFNDKDFLMGRVAYALNLRGPAVTTQTACSTSLVATHLAAQALLAHDCDIALVGGVAINLPIKAGYLALEGAMFSPDGRCRPFDASARGTVFGSGAAVVVLRRLEDALRDGDHVHALVRGTAVNNDGFAKVSFTAPNPRAQAAVIASAQAVAAVSPDTVGYVEAHGTGTPLGDPIEVSALTEAFRLGTARTGFCALGSVKANVGHLDAAAGVAGLVRAALALERETIPPQANFETPNPQLELDRTPFYVPAEPVPWPRSEAPRRAGVSSFGVGGTNAHVVLEESPPPAPASETSRREQVLLLSARTPKALEEASARLAERLEREDAPPLADAAFTLAEGRRRLPARRAVVAADHAEAARLLRATPGPAPQPASDRPVVLMFPGVGTQSPDMALDLYDAEPVFRREVDLCAEHLRGRLDMDVRRFLFPSRVPGPEIDAQSVPHVLAAIFTVEYALARLWMHWGLRPAAMAGHSLGEYVAACLAGVIALPDALDLTVRRGRIFDEIPEGRMMGVALPADELAPFLGEGLTLGAVNGPRLSMVSGLRGPLEELRATLEARGVICRPLPIRMASHSGLLEPFLERFRGIVAGYRLNPPEIPYLSCATGGWITPADATDPAAWARQLRAPVQFAPMLETLGSLKGAVLLETGPGKTLTTLAGLQGAAAPPVAIASMRHPDAPPGDLRCVLAAAGRLWQAGVELDWRAVTGSPRPRRVALPTYPFQRRRHWIEPGYATGPGYVTAAGPAAAPQLRPVLVEPEAVRNEAAGPVLSGREAAVAEVWRTALGVGAVGLDDDFTELGGHSLLAAQVVMQLKPLVAAPLSVADLYAAPTVRGLAALIASREGEGPAPAERIDLRAEVRLDPAIAAEGVAPVRDGPPRTVLLTGATGFLGGHLLSRLAERPGILVRCLVRAPDEAEGERRIRCQIEALGLPQPEPGRVSAVLGDLAAPRLGLAKDAFASLAEEVDAVYHCGAWVNFARPYEVLRATNVGGTEEVLRLAATARLKPVHHVSTVFVNMGAITGGTAFVGEEDPLSEPEGHDTGYTRSKWVAEGLCRIAVERGIPVTVYRPGNILGDSRTGEANHDDYITRMIVGCVELGQAPLRSYPLPVAPVDEVAEAVIVLSLAPGGEGRTYHVIRREPLPWNAIFEAVRAHGYAVPSVPWDAWRHALAAGLAEGRRNALAPVADLLSVASGDRPMPAFGVDGAHGALAARGFAFSSLDQAYAGRVLDRLVAARLLPPPPPLALSATA